MLKIIHEIWHGIATQTFGGVVPEWGVQLIAWVTPLTYLDATSSWILPERWKRCTVAGAGMLIELLIAVIALHIWTHSEPGLLREICFNIVLSASLITLLFNANPLMRFDGYFIFSDLTGVPNLAQKGKQAADWLVHRLFAGVDERPLPQTLRKRFPLLAVYGVASWIWRLIIMIGLIALMVNLFHGIGLLALFAGAVLLASQKIRKLLEPRDPSERRSGFPWGKAWWRVGIAVAITLAVLILVRINPTASGIALVEFSGKALLRASTPGFYGELLCDDGDRITAGQIVLRLHNAEELFLLHHLTAELETAEAKARMLYLKGELPAWQAERERVAGLAEKRALQEFKVASLEIRSPITGRVHAPGLANRLGSYAQPGALLLTILPELDPEIVVSFRQPDFQRIAGDIMSNPQPIRVRLNGKPEEFKAKLVRTSSRATLSLPSPVLASTAGGPLAVRSIDQRETATRQDGLARSAQQNELQTASGSIRPEDHGETLELLQPRFSLFATAGISEDLREGQWGRAVYEGATPESLGFWLLRSIFNYLEKSFTPQEH